MKLITSVAALAGLMLPLPGTADPAVEDLVAQAQDDEGLKRRRRTEVPPPEWSVPESEAGDEQPPAAPPAPEPTERQAEPGQEAEEPLLRRRREIPPPVAPAPEAPPAPAVSDIQAAQIAEPEMDERARRATLRVGGFRPDPEYAPEAYSVDDQLAIYGGKHAVATPRPLIELGYPMYAGGVIGPGFDIIGEKNLVRPQLLVYGDWRFAGGMNVFEGDNEASRVATRLNLDVDLKLTATERIHALFRPLEDDGLFTRIDFDRIVNGTELEDVEEVETSLEPQTLFFEGDLGALWAGFSGRPAGVDLPFAVGRVPLFVQNGVWLDDAFDGLAFAIPAMNSPGLDISNADLAFYFGVNEISTPAILDSTNDAALFAVATFIERRGSYFEIDYGYVRDTADLAVDRSYHSVAFAWTRRFGATLSHSTRIIGNFGQDADPSGVKTADGVLLLLENSLITSKPSTFVPYFNLFYGIDSPQPLAREVGGLLKNTGLNFEADAITGFPALDDTGRNAFGGAFGLEWLFGLERQLVVELAALSRHGDDSELGNQYALGVRFQQPFGRRWIFRADLIAGVREAPDGFPSDDDDFGGFRLELRAKF